MSIEWAKKRDKSVQGFQLNVWTRYYREYTYIDIISAYEKYVWRMKLNVNMLYK